MSNGGGRHGKRTGRTIKIVVRDKATGRVVSEWHEQALGPAGRRGSMDAHGREVHCAAGCSFGVGSN